MLRPSNVLRHQNSAQACPGSFRAETKIRAKAELVSFEEVGGGWWQAVTRFTIEVEAARRPPSSATA
jgi:hypothetical protein